MVPITMKMSCVWGDSPEVIQPGAAHKAAPGLPVPDPTTLFQRKLVALGLAPGDGGVGHDNKGPLYRLSGGRELDEGKGD